MDHLTILVMIRGNNKNAEIYGFERGVEIDRDVEECPNLYEGSLFLFDGIMYQVVSEHDTYLYGCDQAYKFECERVYPENLECLTLYY